MNDRNSATSFTFVRLVMICCTLLILACSEAPSPDGMPHTVSPDPQLAPNAPPCLAQYPEKHAFFGDLHVHTSLSSDAWMFGLRAGPYEALGYAFGHDISLPIENSDGTTRRARIDRPLDFVAITDHAEFLGEQAICGQPESAADNWLCHSIQQGRGRSLPLVAQLMLPWTFRYKSLCGEQGEDCRKAASEAWQTTIDAAQHWNDNTPDCQRTTFIGYEYSSYRLGSNLHRNVIFKNHIVPPLPVSYIEAPREWLLWQSLKKTCIDNDSDCDVLAIPHNSNLSNGRMFNVDYIDAPSIAEQQARNRLRIELEPVVEVMQHKGDSECRNGVPGVLGSEDELCNFEKFEYLANAIRHNDPTWDEEIDSCSDGRMGDAAFRLGPSCFSHLSYTRYALIEGLREEQRLGINPFKFGLIASTDTHNGLAGGVNERSFPGHLGIGDDSIADRVAWDSRIEGNIANNPGGLVGVWATQNRRDTLFESIQNKEVFGTSGPRIQPRFFAGWKLPAKLCHNPDMLKLAYRHGVPMGSDLPVQSGQQGGPLFLATAIADPGTPSMPGTALQRLQIVKGWVDSDGILQNRVYDVAGDPQSNATVDTDTCAQSGHGFGQLCTVWQDPDFQPDRPAVYYLRVVENPSCRYNAWQCRTLTDEARPEGCSSTHAPRIIQERAWTSPIWYTPRQSNHYPVLLHTTSHRNERD